MRTVVLAIALVAFVGCQKKALKQIDFSSPPVEKETPYVEKEKPEEPAPDPIVAQEKAKPISYRGAVYFDFDSDVVRYDAQSSLGEAAEAAGDCSGVVTLVGGACPIGDARYNYGLGVRRANAVKKELQMRYGLDDCQISLESVGETNLVSDDPSEYWRNRRCEISVKANKYAAG